MTLPQTTPDPSFLMEAVQQEWLMPGRTDPAQPEAYQWVTAGRLLRQVPMSRATVAASSRMG
jgi:hypothetical protein